MNLKKNLKNKRGMVWNTVIIIAAFLVFSFLIFGITYFLIKPFNIYSFTLTGSMLAPMEEFANEHYEQANNNSLVAKKMLNYSNVNADTMQEVEEARIHDEMIWLIGGLVGFVVSVLLYTAYTQTQKK